MLKDAYINIEKDIAIGIDGVKIADYKLQGRTIRVKLINQLATLPFPYEKAYDINLKVEGLPDTDKYTLIVNDWPPAKLTAKELTNYKINIKP